MKNKSIKNNFYFFLFTILNISLFSNINPSFSFIPNIYEPNRKILINTSIGIGLTASNYSKYGQTKDAISLAKLALSLNPNEAELWVILSRAQLYSKQLDDALISIKNAQKINEKIPSVWFTKASIEMQLGDINSSIKSIERNIKLDKKNSNSYFLLGNAKLMQKNYSESLEAFSKATNINPKFWQAINNKALVYYELGFKDKAIKTWREVIILESDPEPKLALAIALYALNQDNKEAIELAEEALRQNPNYFFQQFQEEQLWGQKLQTASLELFKNPKLKSVINTASANSSFTNEKEQ